LTKWREKLKDLADFLAILLPSSALATAVTPADCLKIVNNLVSFLLLALWIVDSVKLALLWAFEYLAYGDSSFAVAWNSLPVALRSSDVTEETLEDS